jgi:nucleosome binding factor SPN SPT16 subunit
MFPKENPSGKLVNEWKQALTKNNITLDTVDVSVGVALVLAEKDDRELVLYVLL